MLAARVSLVQNRAGVPHDSSYGSGTTAAVRAHQLSKGLVADGIAGANTHKAMAITRVVGAGTSAIGGSIKRTEIIQRAAYWPTIRLGYSQAKYFRDLTNSKTYRQDCSGQVSNAFHATTSYSTRTLSQITTLITKTQLLPGDILNSYDYHTVVFCGWFDSSRTSYYSMEQSGSLGAVARRVSPYPFFGLGSNWQARRYTKVLWG
ncbi:peptidoglycan-binding domain-containing protein [Aestuariimicrobium sp. Y1814]|uniref:peptidoglycan-binding domain-containing protein n=1 Tax=Aestuariimicrobium sp. Y1814 TaxID=3418742 RepID=UPI003DA7926E